MDTIADIAGRYHCFHTNMLYLLIQLSEPMCVGGDDDDVRCVCVSYASLTYFGDLLHCPHQRYNESVHRNKQHTRGNSAIP